MPLTKAIIVPGNVAGDVERSNWYGWAKKQINKVRTAKVCESLRACARMLPTRDVRTVAPMILTTVLCIGYSACYIHFWTFTVMICRHQEEYNL